MKKLALCLALSSSVALVACQQPTTQEVATVALETSEQRFSYGMAYNMGERMASESLEIDAAAFSLGLADALSGAESKLTPEEVAAEMQAFQERMQAEQMARAEAAADANAAEAEAFFADNATRDGVKVTDSGLQYEVVTQGDGVSLSHLILLKCIIEAHYLMVLSLTLATRVANPSNFVWIR